MIDIARILWQGFRTHGRWGVQLAVIWLLLNTIAPTGVRVALDSPQTVQTAKPLMCVHTRLIDEVQEWVIQKSLQSVREIGADTIVEFFPWAYIESSPGQYNWRQTDLIVKHAQNQGLRVIARMSFVPDWVRPDPKEQQTTLNYLPDNAYDSFADFVAVFAGRYVGVIDDIIIWNEPNLAFEWGYRPPDPAAYAKLLAEVYSRGKGANPNVNVLAGALAPTIEPPGSPHALNDLLYLEALYAAGAAAHFDSLAVHTYGFTEPAEADPAFDLLNFRRAELLRAIMVKYGDADKRIYITESGWNDHPRWTKAVRPAQRIAYTLEGFAWAEANWAWAEKLCVWALRYPRPTNSYPDNFTLITTDFVYKPIYFELQAYARGFDGRVEGERLWLPAPVEG
jgi:hypothetical protein